MSDTWGTHADAVIAAVARDLPQGATIDQARKALSDAYPFGARERWPYKVWRDRVNGFLRARYPEAFREKDRARLRKMMEAKH